MSFSYSAREEMCLMFGLHERKKTAHKVSGFLTKTTSN